MRRRLEASDFSGRVTFITGPERSCGKTSLLNAALALLRGAGESPAFLGIGFDGEAKGEACAGRTRIACEAGEVFVSAERYLEAMAPLPEILEAVPGSTALGRLAIARARGPGAATLVGPERNDYAAWIIDRIKSEGWAKSVVVDGSLNRITQVASFSGARFLCSLRVSESNLPRESERICRLHSLLSLPEGEGGFEVRGPLTAEVAERIPDEAEEVSVEDFTKVFLKAAELRSFLRRRRLSVRNSIEFGGFVVVLREIGEARFLEALLKAAAADSIEAASLLGLIFFNPYLLEPEAEAIR